jgi:magnesium chelatase family protein
MNRLSGPLLDRIDIHVDVPGLTFQEMSSVKPDGPSSADLRNQVQAARDRQRARYNGACSANAHLDTQGLRSHCKLDDATRGIIEQATTQLGLSARAYDKILRIARTLADLDELDKIAEHHVAEAVQYRTLDRQLF